MLSSESNFKNRLIFVFLFLTFCLFAIQGVSALGIGPAKATMDFVPGLEIPLYVDVINNDGKGAYYVNLLKRGDMAEYVTFLGPTEAYLQDGEVRRFNFILKMPDKVERPGDHITYIGAMQKFPTSGGGQIQVRLGIEAQLWVRVPYPGKYLGIDLNIGEARVEKPVKFTISATNLGKENLSNVYGMIEVMEKSNNTITTLQTPGKSIEVGQTETLEAEWIASGLKPGPYKARAMVYYDGEKSEQEKDFMIGAPLITIVNVTTENMFEGEIGKIIVLLKSVWNDPINGVYVTIEILDGEGKLYGDTKTESIDFGPFEEIESTAYWDAEEAGAEAGEYRGLVTVHFLDRDETREITLNLVRGFELTYENLMLIIIIALVLALIFSFLFHRKKRKYKQARLA